MRNKKDTISGDAGILKSREDIINSIYKNTKNEDTRLIRSRHGQLEYATTISYINKYIKSKSKVLEVGAGTGKYSLEIAKAGYSITAVDMVHANVQLIKRRGQAYHNLKVFQADAIDLSMLDDNTFDITLLLGPMYHLYKKDEQLKAIKEAIRVTKKNGIIITAFLPIHGIMHSNYIKDRWYFGICENFTTNFGVKHFKEQKFTGFNIDEFEKLFDGLGTEKITMASADGILETLENLNSKFRMTDETFNDYTRYHLSNCERPELLGYSSHVLYICKKLG